MKKKSILLLVLLSLLVVGCQGSGAEPAAELAPTAAPTEAPSEASSTEPAAVPVEPIVENEDKIAAVLGNLTYGGVLPEQQILLADGTASYDDEGGGTPYVSLVDYFIATGDMNDDGTEDAAAFLVDNTTGSADFVYLVLVLDVQTEPVALEAFLIGDRTPVSSLVITDNQVIMERVLHGSDDVACCPSQLVRQVFALEDGQLVESRREDLGKISPAHLNSTSWQLVDLNQDQQPVLAGTDITLRFEGGQVSGSAGCNSYTSTITAGEEDLPQSLAIGPIEVTQMLCADPISKQETAYLSRLDKAAAWRYAFGYLALTYKLEDDSLGELLFAPEKP